jgi:lipid-binding SYLF domain-containing protein
MVGGNSGATSYNSDIVGWATAKGAYIGLTVNDSTVRQRPEWNAIYYNRTVPVDDVFSSRVCNSDADVLRHALIRD